MVVKFPSGFCVAHSAAGPVLNEVSVNMIRTCSEAGLPLKRPALQVACQKRQPHAPFATKSIHTPRNSWHVRHEMMMGIWPDSLLPAWEAGPRDYSLLDLDSQAKFSCESLACKTILGPLYLDASTYMHLCSLDQANLSYTNLCLVLFHVIYLWSCNLDIFHFIFPLSSLYYNNMYPFLLWPHLPYTTPFLNPLMRLKMCL